MTYRCLTAAALVALFAVTQPAAAQFVVSAGGSEFEEGLSVAPDAVGGAFITGNFFGTATFGSGPAAVTLTSAGNGDAFVARYDESGSLVFAQQIGGPSFDEGLGVASDGDGGAFVTGYFSGTLTLGSGSEAVTLTSAGVEDVFLARYDAQGGLVFAVSAGGESVERSYGVALDGVGGVYIAGQFRDEATFGSGAAADTLTSAGFEDVFLARYDDRGELVYAVRAGGSSFDRGLSVSADGAGGAFVTGPFFGTVTFGSGPDSVTLTSAGGNNTFVARYDAAGSLVYAVGVGGSDSNEGRGVAADGAGGAFVTGYFFGAATFGNEPNAVTLTSSGSGDVFLARYDGEGTLAVGAEMVPALPAAALSVYPNPLDRTTGGTVRLAIGANQDVTLSLFDGLGRRIAVLYRGTVSGSVEAALPTGLAAGVYLVKAEGIGLAETMRVVVAR